MKVYLASHYSRKNEVRAAVADLEAMGIEVVSTWHREKLPSNATMPPGQARTWRRHAEQDFSELLRCTHFVLFSMGPYAKFSRGSHCWENGWAAASGKKCLIVGEPQVIFHHMKGTKLYKTWQSAKRKLKGDFKNEHNTNFTWDDRTITGIIPYRGGNLYLTHSGIYGVEVNRRTRQVPRLSARSNPGSRLVPGLRGNPKGRRASGS